MGEVDVERRDGSRSDATLLDVAWYVHVILRLAAWPSHMALGVWSSPNCIEGKYVRKFWRGLKNLPLGDCPVGCASRLVPTI